ncbi:MAG TPA: hypothetical protein VNL18_10825 [Gemmatimonadales bacterium]|nr:hypothetical protein [Gemmatimonadales bacterium]
MLLAATLVLSLAGCATPTVSDSARGSTESPVAERPTWTPGDSWTYRAVDGSYTFEQRFVGETTFENQPALHIVRGRYDMYFSKDFGFIARELNGRVVRRMTPPTDHPWPLKVGKTWYWSGTWEDTERTLQRYIYSDVWTVERYEEVTVPAGTFKAFKIVRRVPGTNAYDEIWFSPQVKSIVKSRGSSAAGTYDEELVSYKVH